MHKVETQVKVKFDKTSSQILLLHKNSQSLCNVSNRNEYNLMCHREKNSCQVKKEIIFQLNHNQLIRSLIQKQ